MIFTVPIIKYFSKGVCKMKFTAKDYVNDDIYEGPEIESEDILNVEESLQELDDLFESIQESVDRDLEDFDLELALSEMDEEDDDDDIDDELLDDDDELLDDEDLEDDEDDEDDETLDEYYSEFFDEMDDLDEDFLDEMDDLDDFLYEMDEEDGDDDDEDDDEDDDDSLEEHYNDFLDELDDDFLSEDEEIDEILNSPDMLMEGLLLDDELEELSEYVDLESINEEIDDLLAESEQFEEIDQMFLDESEKLSRLLENIDILENEADEDTYNLNSMISENISLLDDDYAGHLDEGAAAVAKRREKRKQRNSMQIDFSLNGHSNKK
jgi:hypothetical protein